MKLRFKSLSLAAISCCVLLSGCASSRPNDLSYLFSDIEAQENLLRNNVRPAAPFSTSNYDQPDRADTGLPPLKFNRVEPVKPKIQNYRPEDLQVTIQPGALLQVSVKEDPELDGNYEVNDIGAISLGYIGPIILRNKNAQEAATKTAEILKRRNFRTATVSLKIVRASYDRIYIGGDVNNPGHITIGAGDTITLNNALLRAQGIKPSVKGAKVKIIQGGLTNAMAHVAKGKVYSLVSKSGKAAVPNIQLKNNDVAFVLSTESKVITGGGEKEITVLGEVKRPGVFKFTGEEPCTVMHLMFKLGELPLYANKEEVKIFRKNNRGSEEEFVVNVEDILDKGKIDDDIPLEHNDRVLIPRLGFRWF